MLKVGEALPKFDLAGDDDERHGSAELRGRRAVVFFYPRDNTPGCTREAIAFTKARAAFAKAGVVVVGISRDSIASHQKFKAQHRLGVLLLSDPDLEAHRAFGAWGKKTLYGKKVEGVVRSTFAFDARGKVTHVWSPVKVDGHVEVVLEALAK